METLDGRTTDKMQHQMRVEKKMSKQVIFFSAGAGGGQNIQYGVRGMIDQGSTEIAFWN